MTWCSKNASRILANVASSRGRERSMPVTSAPRCLPVCRMEIMALRLEVALEIHRRIRHLDVAAPLVRRQRGVDDHLGDEPVLTRGGIELVAVRAWDRHRALVPAQARAERPHHIGRIEDVDV